MVARPPFRTVEAKEVMAALGQKQTCAAHQPMSALPPIATVKADIARKHGYALSSRHSGQGTHNADGTVIRWCFADASLAAAFASEFGTT